MIQSFNHIIKSKLNVRQTEALIKKMKIEKKQKIDFFSKNSIYNNAEVDLQNFLDTKVLIKKGTSNTGKILIEFLSDDDLNRIIKKMK